MKNIYTLILLICFFSKLKGICKSDIGLGYTLTLPIPSEYDAGFIGKAYIIHTESKDDEASFKAALTIEASGGGGGDDGGGGGGGGGGGQYSCSIQVFLGDVKVWSSGHYSKSYVSDECMLELTKDGDLRLKSHKNRVRWRTGTGGQGVERLKLLTTGNLVLIDAMNMIKWQSFNFPTDVMLQGQRLDVATQLTSFPSNSNGYFYSFEVLRDKIALFLNSDHLKYSYWEFKPTQNQNINFVKLGLEGLDLFDDNSHKIARIEPERRQPLRFMAVGNKTGNLGLYSYLPEKGKFETLFQALNDTCDLPLACKSYGICTFSKGCSCINSGCGDWISEDKKGFCGREMIEVAGVKTVLKDGTPMGNVSKEDCEELCKKDCKCSVAMYDSDEGCFLYGVVMGVKQIQKDPRLSFMVKISKGKRNSGVKKWILGLVGAVDGFVILIVLFGVLYYFIRKRRKPWPASDSQS